MRGRWLRSRPPQHHASHTFRRHEDGILMIRGKGSVLTGFPRLRFTTCSDEVLHHLPPNQHGYIAWIWPFKIMDRGPSQIQQPARAYTPNLASSLAGNLASSLAGNLASSLAGNLASSLAGNLATGTSVEFVLFLSLKSSIRLSSQISSFSFQRHQSISLVKSHFSFF